MALGERRSTRNYRSTPRAVEHRLLLTGRGQSCIDPTHRKPLQRSRIVIDDSIVVVRGAGDVVARRSLEFYDALGRIMAVKENA